MWEKETETGIKNTNNRKEKMRESSEKFLSFKFISEFSLFLQIHFRVLFL